TAPASQSRRCRLRFQVRDTGIGIEPAQQSALFQPFHQVETSSTRRFEGTGLGLFISRRLVQLMGGEIELQSEPGAGSCFGFELDLETTHTARHSPAADALQGTRLLIIDDHPTNRKVFRELA
ncbi:MAG: hypothetical protein GWN58_11990, partial [Anaerolineae bacterium]|nr:hypothetical protein [Anaerolineae bacterium]